MDEELKVTFTLEEEQPIDCVFRIDATTFDYEELDKKPQINGETLIGNKTSEELHLASLQGLQELDEKVDGININLTQQIEETQQDVNNKYNELLDDISDLSDTVDDNYDELDGKIDSTANTINQRITDVADELQQSIEDNVIALQQEDTALQNQINTQNQTLTNHNQRITANASAIAQEILDRQNADDTLQDQIDNLKARGRFLSLWNATTGLAETNPEIDPYPYNTGDYFIVGTVGETNYKPTGTQYVIGQASTVIETEELATEDVYYFDGSVWHLQINHGKTVSFANLAGQPSDNIALKNALDSKQGVISDLSTIRTNAQAGKNASDTIANYGDIVTHNANEFATATALTQGLATKQDTLVSGTNIKTINNTSILGNGDIEIRGASSFAELEGQPEDNANLKNALDNKTQVIIRSW